MLTSLASGPAVPLASATGARARRASRVPIDEIEAERVVGEAAEIDEGLQEVAGERDALHGRDIASDLRGIGARRQHDADRQGAVRVGSSAGMSAASAIALDALSKISPVCVRSTCVHSS